eukprot:10140314-Ditylum_brightwellii.AAC.1
MVSKRLSPALVVTQSNSQTEIEIKYKNPYTPHAILGHLKAPDRGNNSQKNKLTDKAGIYAIKASSSSLNHHKARMYYNSCYIKLVGYVLGQCFFTSNKLDEIENDTIRAFTSRSGYNKNMAT